MCHDFYQVLMPMVPGCILSCMHVCVPAFVLIYGHISDTWYQVCGTYLVQGTGIVSYGGTVISMV